MSSSDEGDLELKTCKKLKGRNQKLFDDSSEEDSDFLCEEKYHSESRCIIVVSPGPWALRIVVCKD